MDETRFYLTLDGLVARRLHDGTDVPELWSVQRSAWFPYALDPTEANPITDKRAAELVGGENLHRPGLVDAER